MIKSIIWDYDGTLADSNKKNYHVSLDLFKNEAPQIFDLDPPNLRSLEAFSTALTEYEDWKELYSDCYHLDDNEIERLGKLWTKYQLNSDIRTDIFPGLDRVIKKHSKTKQAVISQNGTDNIISVLKSHDLLEFFSVFIGIDEIPFEYQKPHYLSMIKCLEQLNIDPAQGRIIYVGDHEVDTQFVRASQKYFSENGIDNDLISVATSYGGSTPDKWVTRPDYIADSIDELEKILDVLEGE